MNHLEELAKLLKSKDERIAELEAQVKALLWKDVLIPGPMQRERQVTTGPFWRSEAIPGNF
jgi:hypothetical protein